ncbi:YaaC family protein [Soonwooa sp.]|uniref:YaaC family protein n=1 Tax=Soonwooa sp. TaxID=1938592 RepID=UPI00289EDE79|nr:YaaC family protein [Soonwooa sp.]
MNKIWHKLYDYESRDLIERFISKKHNRKASARQVSEISSNIIQSREFFRNAEDANLSVKPLLLYYGVNSLSRGLVLLLNPYLSESSLKPSHGLDTINWRQSISENNLKDLTVEINNGGFYELLTSTKNKSYLKLHSSGINWKVNFPVPNLKKRFTLENLIRIIPDLNVEYNKWLNENFETLKVSKFASNDMEYRFTIEKFKINQTIISNNFDSNILSNIRITENTSNFEIAIPVTYFPQLSQSINEDIFGIGNVTLCRLIPDNIYLNSISQLYCLSFYLGMLSRYFPSYWINLNKTEKGDSIYPLLLKSIDLIIDDYPTLIYEFLEGPYNFEIAE